MTMFGPITNRDQIRWQIRSHRVLGDLLNHAYHNNLPAISWTIVSAGAGLVGNCLHTKDAAGQRDAFNAWTAFVDGKKWTEARDGDKTRLHSVADSYQGVKVVITADVYEDRT